MYFFMGFFGALACLVMFGAGFVAGWSAYRLTRRRKPSKRELQPEQDARREIQSEQDAGREIQTEQDAGRETQSERDARREIQAEQDAFRRLQNYSAEDAYGRSQRDELPAT